MANKEATPLSTMLGKGDGFEIEDKINGGKKTYTVLPLLLSEVDDFIKSGINVSYSVFNLIDDKARKSIDVWLQKKVKNESGESVSLEKAKADGWDLSDLTKCIELIMKLSG